MSLRRAYASLCVAIAVLALSGCNQPAGQRNQRADKRADKAAPNSQSADNRADEPAPESTGDMAGSTADDGATETAADATTQAAGPAANGGVKPAAFVDAGQLEPADMIMPKVLLSKGHEDTCLVKVGDSLPELSLADLEGQQQAVADMLGERLTVVLFWDSKHPYAVEELGDLGPDVAEKYSGRGLKVLAVNVGDMPEDARMQIENAGATFPNLIDPDGMALAQLATQKLPRTYLVDAQGKILWFDIEYSRSTRRDLQRAIRFTLSQAE